MKTQNLSGEGEQGEALRAIHELTNNYFITEFTVIAEGVLSQIHELSRAPSSTVAGAQQKESVSPGVEPWNRRTLGKTEADVNAIHPPQQKGSQADPVTNLPVPVLADDDATPLPSKLQSAAGCSYPDVTAQESTKSALPGPDSCGGQSLSRKEGDAACPMSKNTTGSSAALTSNPEGAAPLEKKEADVNAGDATRQKLIQLLRSSKSLLVLARYVYVKLPASDSFKPSLEEIALWEQDIDNAEEVLF